MESVLGYHDAKALLAWQIELGATEAIGDAPVNRYELPEKSAEPAAAATPARAAPSVTPSPEPTVDPVAVAKSAAANAGSLEGLRDALAVFPHCDLKRGARNLVFSDGLPGARVMIIGEAPGRDEDREARPFVGRAGQLLDRMFAAIGLGRAPERPEDGIYLTNVLPWRPPQNRDPTAEEIAMMRPFLARHVELANPDFVVLMGNISCDAGLEKRGITRLRGTWTTAYGKPALSMVHPAYLLRTPSAKREAWADLLSLQARLRGGA